MTQVYVGMGGNIGDTRAVLSDVLKELGSSTNVTHLAVSRFYLTSPVSPIPQNNYINAVCSFKWQLSARELLGALQKIEQQFGKEPKAKEAPRVIDLDILFFGQEIHRDPDLEIPHPRWKGRLFVLKPLSDLVSLFSATRNGNLEIIDIQKIIKSFPNNHNEIAIPLSDEPLIH